MTRQFAFFGLAVLTACASFAADSFVLTSEHRVASDGARIAAPYRQNNVLLTAGPASQFLAIWEDARTENRNERSFFRDQRALVAARISATGEVLDPDGIVIDPAAGHVELLSGFSRSVAWNGRDYVIVATKGETYHSFLIAPDGTMRPPVDLRVSSRSFKAIAAGNGREAVVALNGVLWYLDENGAIEQTVPLPSVANIDAIVPQGNDWILITPASALQEASWYRVNRSGIAAVRSFAFNPLHTARPRLSAANNGLFTFVAWQSIRDHGNATWSLNTSALLLSADGEVAFDWRLASAQATLPPFASRPSVAWDGQSFVLGWREVIETRESELRVSRLYPGEAAVLRPKVIARTIHPDAPAPAVAASSQGVVVAWEKYHDVVPFEETDIVVRVVADVESLEATPTRILSESPANEQDVRAAASSDGAIFTVWREAGPPGRIGGELTRADGTRMGRLGISASTIPSGYPAVAWANGIFLVVWREEELFVGSGPEPFGVLARRYNDRGEPLDAAPVVLARQHISPRSNSLERRVAVASNGRNFLVAWVAGVTDRDVFATRVAFDGSLPAPQSIQIATPGAQTFEPGIFVDRENNYVVWWTETFTPQMRAAAASVSDSGLLVENPRASFVRMPPDPLREGGVIPFDVASNGVEVLTTWRRRASTASMCIYAARTDPSGQPPVGTGEQIACGLDLDPDAASDPRGLWDGQRWWVVYSFYKGSLSAVPLDAAGKPAGAPYVIVAEGEQIDPFAIDTRRGIGVFYNRIDAASHHVRRAFVRFLAPPRERAARH